MHFFWVTFFFLTLFTGSFTQGPEDSIIVKCAKYMPKDTNIQVNGATICQFFMPNFTNCVEKDIYNSENIVDQIFVRNMNIKKLKNAVDYICSKRNTIVGENLTCISNIGTCFSINDVSLKCYNNIIPCIYKAIASCSWKGAMLFSKALTIIKSNACKLSSTRYNLKPFYGPELHCYPNVQTSSGTAAAKLGQNYMYFCEKFKKETVFQCIEEKLLTKKNDTYLDNDYIKNAKEFFRQRSHLCDYFTRYNPKTCPSLNVLSCQEDLYKTDALLKSFDVLLKSYAGCVYDKYKTCNATLAKIIKYNLVGNNSNSVHFSAPLIFILSQLALVITLLF